MSVSGPRGGNLPRIVPAEARGAKPPDGGAPTATGAPGGTHEGDRFERVRTSRAQELLGGAAVPPGPSAPTASRSDVLRVDGLGDGGSSQESGLTDYGNPKELQVARGTPWAHSKAVDQPALEFTATDPPGNRGLSRRGEEDP